MTTAQTAALKTELQSDPRGYGYAQWITAGSDNNLAATINTIRDGTAGTVPTNPTAAGGAASGIISVKRPDISVDELMEAIAATDLAAVNSLQQEYFQILLSRPQVQLLKADGTDTRRWTNLKLGIGNAGGSQTRLTALASRPGSRAEELFGQAVSSSDISFALRGS